MTRLDNDPTLTTIATITSELAALGRSGDAGEIEHRLHVIIGLADNVRDKLRSDAPALHMAFDDTDEQAALVVTPSLNMRVGDEVHRLALICREDLDADVVRRALGPEVTKSVLSLFSISELLREIGVESLTALSEDLEGQVGKYVQEAVEEPIAL